MHSLNPLVFHWSLFNWSWFVHWSIPFQVCQMFFPPLQRVRVLSTVLCCTTRYVNGEWWVHTVRACIYRSADAWQVCVQPALLYFVPGKGAMAEVSTILSVIKQYLPSADESSQQTSSSHCFEENLAAREETTNICLQSETITELVWALHTQYAQQLSALTVRSMLGLCECVYTTVGHHLCDQLSVF